MRVANNAKHEWLFRPSVHQTWLNSIVVVVGFLMFVSALPLPFALMLSIVFGPAAIMWRVKAHKQGRRTVNAVGLDNDGWWVAFDCQRSSASEPWKAIRHKRVNWKVGTIRGEEWVILKWGYMPWQSIDIRPECLPNREAFRELKRVLYTSLEGDRSD